jgi:hypothetical protein
MPRDPFAPIPGYYDLPGARMLPGGSLAASRSNTGQARGISGVDIPVVGYPNTGWYPGMPTESAIPGVGLPLRGGEVGGGPTPGYSPATTSGDYPGGSYGHYPAPDMNIPTNEDVLPAIQQLLYRNIYQRGYIPSSAPNPTPGPSYPDLSNASPVIVDASRGGFSYPDLSNAPPVTVDASAGGSFNGSWLQNAMRDLSSLPPVSVNPPGYYPTPGAGGSPSGDWRQNSVTNAWAQNARSGYQPWQTAANQAASAAGFGGGLISQGSGGWQNVSEIPSGAFGSIGPSNAFGGGGSRVFQL